MNNSALPYWLALMVLAVASYGGWKWWQVQQFEANREVGGIEFDGPTLEQFELTERSGQPFRSRDMLGKVWVTTFFFATCPGACPRLNANIQHLHNLEQLEDVTWVSITVDPVTDTLAKLREYADQFGADRERWLFCRGEFDYVQRIARDFMNVAVSWRGHQDFAVVIDKHGKIRGMYDAIRLSQLDKLQTLLLKCLEEAGPSPQSTNEEAPEDLEPASPTPS
jgi:cytochrome oxidase Cu insertion factor (SCO1/SenC/PrrC family)